jgi:hypothetical protein
VSQPSGWVVRVRMGRTLVDWMNWRRVGIESACIFGRDVVFGHDGGCGFSCGILMGWAEPGGRCWTRDDDEDFAVGIDIDDGRRRGHGRLVADCWPIVESLVESGTRCCRWQSANMEPPRWADIASMFLRLMHGHALPFAAFLQRWLLCPCLCAHAGTCGTCVAQYASGWTGFDASEDGLYQS